MADEIEKRIKLTVVTEDATLKSLRAELKKFKTELEGIPVLSAGFKDVNTSVDSLKNTITAYANQAKNGSKEIQTAIKLEQAEQRRLEDSINKVNVALEKKRALQSIKDAQRDLGLTGQTSSLGSIEAMMGRLAGLNEQLLRIDTTSEAFVVLKQKIALAKQELENVGASAHGSTRGMANMGVAMQNLNYVVRDSAYFSQSFAFGVLAIGNNLNPMIDSMMRANKEAKSLNSTFGKEMLGFLKGPGGIVLLLSVAVTAFQALTFAMAKNNSTMEDGDSAYKTELDNISKMIEKLRDLSTSYEEATRLNRELIKEQKQGMIDKYTADKKLVDDLIKNGDVRFGFRQKLDPEDLKFLQEMSRQYGERLKQLTSDTPEFKSYLGLLNDIQIAAKNGVSAIDELNISNIDLGHALQNLKTRYDELKPSEREYLTPAIKNLEEYLRKHKGTQNLGRDFVNDLKIQRDLLELQNKPMLALLEKQKEQLSNALSLEMKDADRVKLLNEQVSLHEKIKEINKDIIEGGGNWGKTAEQIFNEINNFKPNGVEKRGQKIEESLRADKLIEEHKKFIGMAAELNAHLIKDSAEREKALFKLKMSDEIAFAEQMLTEKIINEDELNAYRKALLQDYENFAVDIHAKEIERWTGLTSILESNFSSLWENVFGEANSLVEQLGQNVLSVLGEVAAEELTHILAKHLFEKAETATTAAVATATATASIATIGAEMVALAAATFPAALAVNIASFGAAGAAAAISAEAASLALTTAMIPKFHDGGIVGSEVNIIAKKGEMVLNNDQQSNLWSMINNGGSRQGSQPINITLQNVMDGKVIDSRVYRILPDVQRQLIREGYMN